MAVPRNDVFISFRGIDTRNNFVDHLCAALVQEGIGVFENDLLGVVGSHISKNLVKAIEESRVSIVVLSHKYADSSWCLDELSEIMECHKQMGRTVLPVFYHVDSSDVHGQKGEFATAFEKHQDKFDYDRVKKWRDALTAAANLPGHYILPHNREYAFINKIVQEISANKQPRGKLSVSDKEIGKGSNGTIVLEGIYDTDRPVAVKRIMKVRIDVALNERQNLILSDYHTNIVRYHVTEHREDFVDIALERCICSLHELILSQTNPNTDRLLKLTSEFESFKLLDPNGYPSPELLNLMRDAVAGLAHLHELGIIHRDIEPQNVLICKYSINGTDNGCQSRFSIRAKVSDLGISKRLPAGTANIFAEDLERLGWLLLFCITGGRRSFGDIRELSSLKDKIPEAFDLVKNLIESRLKAAEAYHHPLFWGADMRLSFLHDAFDYLISKKRTLPPNPNPVDHLNRALESIGKDDFGSRGQWSDKVHKAVVNHANNFCRWNNLPQYVKSSVLDLLRLIRNYREHHRKLPENIRKKLGDVPTGYEWYFRKRFPNLLIQVYNVLKPHCGEKSLQMYYEKIVGLKHK